MSEPAYQDLTEVADGVIVRPMLTLDRAIDDYLADCRARGWSKRTVPSYAATLYRLADRLPVDTDVAKVTTDDLRRYRSSRQRRLSPNTMAGEEAHLASFFRWLYANGKIRTDPMTSLARTKRVRNEDLDVKSIGENDVRRLLAEARPGPERNAIAILAYLGPRRHAVSMLKRDDYDGRRLRFREKGRKTIWKPVPLELARILDASIAADDLWPAPDDYLVPPQASLRREGQRDDRVIWRLVGSVAERAGVDTHVHALRAAFACFYLERYPDDALGLKDLMGHQSLQTTLIYLRRLDRNSRMERVRDLSWSQDGQQAGANEPLNHAARNPTTFDTLPVVGAGGFEPPFPSLPDEQRDGTQLEPVDLLGDLLRGVHAERIDVSP